MRSILNFVAFTLLVAPEPACASLKDIRTEKLPHDTAVEKTYANLLTVEPLASRWSDKWTYEVPKEKVAAVLKTALTDLQKATAVERDNEELWLLTGLAAIYAYNVDLAGSFELAAKSFAEAQKLAPVDYRSQWFLASLECQTLQNRQGMNRLLRIETKNSWEKLPATFWDDYLMCSELTAMPAHTLRAADHLRRLGAERSVFRDMLTATSRKRFTIPEPTEKYSSEQVWSANERDSIVEFTSLMFGLQFSVPADWTVKPGGADNALTMFQIGVGPFKGPAGDIVPNIVVLVGPRSLANRWRTF